MLNKKFVPFTVLDLSFLTKENYDEGWVKNVYKTPVVTLQDLKGGRVAQKVWDLLGLILLGSWD